MPESPDEGLLYLERPATAAAAGLLVLHHGRGTDERDLLGLAEALDPEGRLLVVTPRAPLRLPGSPGYHWYIVERVGYPHRESFEAARSALGALHDRLWEESGLGPERTVLGGFSMGTVMSHAMAFGADRPPVAGLLGFSGFMPVVEGWRPSLEDRRATRAFLAHGRGDAVIDVGFGRGARELLEAAGLPVEYHESALGHQIDPGQLAAARSWLRETITG